MVNPVPGYKITTAYGVAGGWSGGRHGGADWAAPCGTEVVAAWGGVVTGASWGSAYGTQIVVDQDRLPDGSAGLWAVYAHLSESFVRAGQRIEAGQRIGRIGHTGNVKPPGPAGCHLHYEVQRAAGWQSGNHVNPQPWIDAGGAAPPPQPTGWKHPAGTKCYAKYVKFDGHEQNADRHSVSIEIVQEMLQRHGYSSLPITGKYWTETDAAVRDDQAKHLPPADPERASYVGPKQFAHLKEATGAPYEWVAEEVGGGGPTPPPPPPPPVVQWFLAPSLAALRDEVDGRWPGRDTSSDGTIGDTAHSQGRSEHNPVGHPNGPEFGTPGAVHAIDITANGIDVPLVLDSVIGDHRVWYAIHDGHIWSKTYQWAKRPYTGSNPHKTHIHISLAADDQVSAVRNEQDVQTWVVDVVPIPPPADDQVSWAEMAALLRSIADRIDNAPPHAA